MVLGYLDVFCFFIYWFFKIVDLDNFVVDFDVMIVGIYVLVMVIG